LMMCDLGNVRNQGGRGAHFLFFDIKDTSISIFLSVHLFDRIKQNNFFNAENLFGNFCVSLCTKIQFFIGIKKLT
jgi:hypothetical protein